jgi:hypothetical protein
MSRNCELGRGLRTREKNATEGGAGRFEKTTPDARAAPPEAHVSLIGRKTVEEGPLTGLSFTPDISAKHFPKAAELYPTAGMVVGHSNYQGIGFNFAVDTSGLTAIGSRIHLHSPGMLICIGEERNFNHATRKEEP